MYNTAMDKIRDEMAAGGNEPMKQRIGTFLTEYLQGNPEAAPQLAEEGKSIADAVKALTAHAKKLPRSGGCAVMEDRDAYAVVLAYYGLHAEPAAAPERPAKAAGDALDLDALLGL